MPRLTRAKLRQLPPRLRDQALAQLAREDARRLGNSAAGPSPVRTPHASGGPAVIPGDGPMVRPAPRGMNRWEALHDQWLDLRRFAGEIRWHAFESIKLRLGERCWYTPDFLVCMTDGTLEVHEVKGFARDDAMVKFKAAAHTYPWIVFRMFGRQQAERLTLNSG